MWFFSTGLAGIHGHYENWTKAVAFVRGHFKGIFTLWTIRVVICSSVSVFKQKHILLSSHFMVWRTKSITCLVKPQYVSFVKDPEVRLSQGEDGEKDPIYLSFFSLCKSWLCNLVFLLSSLTVLVLLGWYLFFVLYFFLLLSLLFFPCLLLFIDVYLGVACVSMERKRQAMPWHRGPEERTEITVASFTGRRGGKEGGRLFLILLISYW